MKNIKNVCKVVVSITLLWSTNSNAFSDLNTDKQNEDSISALDKMITQRSTVIGPVYGQTAYMIDYRGENSGEECTVHIKRIDYLKWRNSNLQLHFYGVSIFKNGEVVCETNMSYADELDKNTDTGVKWKQSYFKPKFISNKYNSMSMIVNGDRIGFNCRNYAKAKAGYIVGVDQNESCFIAPHKNRIE